MQQVSSEENHETSARPQPTVRFFRSGTVDGAHSHSHGDDSVHSHQHEIMESPGLFLERDAPACRSDWATRAFTVGIGGPVGSGKTALILSLCRFLRDVVELVVVTNDIFTREDWEFLTRNDALNHQRMAAVETGGCPHAAIREDVSVNIESVKRLTRRFKPHIAFVESGGDNLAANFSRELADYIIYVIDVAGGDKIPRKGGPGITQSDLLVINKTDIAAAVGASLEIMETQAMQMRQGGPLVAGQVKHFVGISDIARHILTAYNEQVRRGTAPLDVEAICRRPICDFQAPVNVSPTAVVLPITIQPAAAV